jgi:hypothetical protein
MHVPGKRGKVHDQNHLSESDLNLCNRDAIDKVYNVAGVSTRPLWSTHL